MGLQPHSQDPAAAGIHWLTALEPLWRHNPTRLPWLHKLLQLILDLPQQPASTSKPGKMDDDDFGADEDLLAAMTAAHPAPVQPAQRRPTPRIQQPTPQRLDKAPPSAASSSGPPKVVQPTPQTLPSRSSGSSILVSPRQKGNPVLACLRSVAWEYSDIPADYGLGLTTCALFLRCVSFSLLTNSNPL